MLLIDEEIINNAQVAFFNGDSWAIIAGRKRITALTQHREMPHVNCPVIDTRGISDDAAMCSILSRNLGPFGCKNIPALLDEMQAIGGIVLNLIPESD